MTTQNLPFTPADLRVTLVYGVVPVVGEGPSLSEIDSSGLPDGALAFSVYKNALYRLKKSSTVVPDTTSNFNNVVAASGGGNWVRTVQLAQVSLTGGAGSIVDKFDLTGGTAQYVVTPVVVAGTPGSLTATKSAPATVTVASSSGSDTSAVLVQVIQNNLVA